MTIARVGTPSLSVNVIGGTTTGNNYSPTVGNLCLIIGSYFNSALLTLSLSDTRGNAITLVTFANDGAHRGLAIWSVPIVTGGAGTFTVSVSSGPSGFVSIQVSEYSGCDSGGALDGTPVSAATGTLSTTQSCGGSVTLSQSTSLLFTPSIWSASQASVSNSLSGAGQRFLTNDGSSGDCFEISDAIGNAAGGYSNTKTGATSGSFAGALIGIKAASSGPSERKSQFFFGSDNVKLPTKAVAMFMPLAWVIERRKRVSEWERDQRSGLLLRKSRS